jgi:hypothetical protein
VEAVFGTTLGTTLTGSGTVQKDPNSALHPFGSVVRLSAIPATGHAFAVWGNAASGNANPLLFPVTNLSPVVSSLFVPLNAGQHALTILPTGRGQVTLNPRANTYAEGTGVTLTALPEAGQRFLGWSGDAAGSQNPLSLTMTASKVITASFTRNPVLAVDSVPVGEVGHGCRLELTGEAGGVCQIQVSTNLVDWATLTTLTNTYGRAQFTDDAAAQSPHRFYRALQ